MHFIVFIPSIVTWSNSACTCYLKSRQEVFSFLRDFLLRVQQNKLRDLKRVIEEQTQQGNYSEGCNLSGTLLVGVGSLRTSERVILGISASNVLKMFLSHTFL